MNAKLYLRNDGEPTPRACYFPSREELGLKKTDNISEDRHGFLVTEGRDEDKNRPAVNNKIFWLDEHCEKQKRILEHGEFFAWVNYPHICKWDEEKREYIGVIAGRQGNNKRYKIKVGEIVEIENLLHLVDLFERYRFLNQVDKEGNIIVKNVEGCNYEILDKNGIKEEFKQMAKKANVPLANLQI